jgi:hypothetical protein
MLSVTLVCYFIVVLDLLGIKFLKKYHLSMNLWNFILKKLLQTRWGYPCLASVSPPPPLTHTYKFKRFGVSAFPDKKFPVEAVPILAIGSTKTIIKLCYHILNFSTFPFAIKLSFFDIFFLILRFNLFENTIKLKSTSNF